MSLFRRYIRSEAARLNTENVRVRFIGERDRLEKRLRDMMTSLETQTQNNTRLNLTIAINYGGRDEIARAAKRVAIAVKRGELDVNDVTEQSISDNLDTRGLPDPDLVIRTSGEFRTSNFLPFQSTYAEYAFVETAWPDFTSEKFTDVLDCFSNRVRRFGSVANL
jgi:undecaprenyl diphosphate synthase